MVIAFDHQNAGGIARMNLPKSPPAGEGKTNTWVFRAALACVNAGLSDEEAAEMIEDEINRDPEPNEIKRALQNARRRGSHTSGPQWPLPNYFLISQIAKAGPTVAEITNVELGEPKTEEIIDALFPGNPLLCVGKSKRIFATRRREAWRGKLHHLSLIVPSPMSAVSGITQEGRLSAKSNDNTGPRRYLVVEFDKGTLDSMAARLWHLKERKPLKMVVHSGGKSLHGWFPCNGDMEEFFRYAVSIGADNATWTRSQFVRMPDGQREPGCRQRVIFYE
jgi:hypothetical protein